MRVCVIEHRSLCVRCVCVTVRSDAVFEQQSLTVPPSLPPSLPHTIQSMHANKQTNTHCLCSLRRHSVRTRFLPALGRRRRRPLATQSGVTRRSLVGGAHETVAHVCSSNCQPPVLSLHSALNPFSATSTAPPRCRRSYNFKKNSHSITRDAPPLGAPKSRGVAGEIRLGKCSISRWLRRLFHRFQRCLV